VPAIQSFSLSSDFALIEKKDSVSFWASGKKLLATIDEDIANSSLIAKIKEHNFNEPKTYKIVSIATRKTDSKISWPVKGKISSGYGMRLHPVTRKRSFHNGIDIKAKRGTGVLAPMDGTVIAAGRAGLLGRLVKIQTKNGMIMYFAHLTRYKCRRGQRVKKGQLIGTVGSSGRATGPHLHFSVKQNSKYLNPLKILEGR
jgi:murein DD-endopeptidase MepM/ murein hydrolase activator NlpD